MSGEGRRDERIGIGIGRTGQDRTGPESRAEQRRVVECRGGALVASRRVAACHGGGDSAPTAAHCRVEAVQWHWTRLDCTALHCTITLCYALLCACSCVSSSSTARAPRADTSRASRTSSRRSSESPSWAARSTRSKASRNCLNCERCVRLDSHTNHLCSTLQYACASARAY